MNPIRCQEQTVGFGVTVVRSLMLCTKGGNPRLIAKTKNYEIWYTKLLPNDFEVVCYYLPELRRQTAKDNSLWAPAISGKVKANIAKEWNNKFVHVIRLPINDVHSWFLFKNCLRYLMSITFVPRKQQRLIDPHFL